MLYNLRNRSLSLNFSKYEREATLKVKYAHRFLAFFFVRFANNMSATGSVAASLVIILASRCLRSITIRFVSLHPCLHACYVS